MASEATNDEVVNFAYEFDRIAQSVGQFIRGKDGVVRLSLVCLTAGGHLLIDDKPGVGKTSLAKALSTAIAGSNKRIQFTPDLLPSDVIGVTVYSKETEEFRFIQGPIFANIVLADEINRASPKTQSALLEVMEERQVSVEGLTYTPPTPFLVVATQNPVEFDGTYHLPEAQIDRFLMKFEIGYPAPEHEVDILRLRTSGAEAAKVEQVSSVDRIRHMIDIASRVRIPTNIFEAIVELAAATRTHPQIELGVSPRGALALARATQAWAASDSRTAVTMDDVKFLAKPVLAHRLMLSADAEHQGISREQVVDHVLQTVRVPTAAGALG